MQHNVKVENTFSGPLDLMLHLVMRDELDIHDIPISHLTREFLAEMERLELVDVDAGGEFVAMASMLTEIKSRMLLPPAQLEGAEGEEEEDFDPRAGLVQALLEYKRFKEVAAELETLAQRHMGRFGRMAEAPAFSVEIRREASELGALDLFAAFQRIARRLLNESAPKEIVSEEVPTEVRIQQIQSVIEQCERASFTALLSDNPTRDEMVGFFIAILELIRLKKIRAQQSADFTEIYFFKYDPQREERPESRVEEIRRLWRLLLRGAEAFAFSGRYPAVRCPRWLHLLPLTRLTGTLTQAPRQIPAAELMYHRGVERYRPPQSGSAFPEMPASTALTRGTDAPDKDASRFANCPSSINPAECVIRRASYTPEEPLKAPMHRQFRVTTRLVAVSARFRLFSSPSLQQDAAVSGQTTAFSGFLSLRRHHSPKITGQRRGAVPALLHCPCRNADSTPKTRQAQQKQATINLPDITAAPALIPGECAPITAAASAGVATFTHPTQQSVKLTGAQIRSGGRINPASTRTAPSFSAPIKSVLPVGGQVAPVAGRYALFTRKPPTTPPATRRRPRFGIC